MMTQQITREQKTGTCWCYSARIASKRSEERHHKRRGYGITRNRHLYHERKCDLYDGRWDLQNVKPEHAHPEDLDSEDETPEGPSGMNPKCDCAGEIGFGLTLQELDERTPDEYVVLRIYHEQNCPLAIFNPTESPPGTPY